MLGKRSSKSTTESLTLRRLKSISAARAEYPILHAGKATFVSLLGEERARQQAGFLVDQAIEHLSSHGTEADLLRAIARFAIERDH